MYQLSITRPGSLEPGIHAEITPAKRSMIERLLAEDIDYGTFIWLMDGEHEPEEAEISDDGELIEIYAPGAGESVEAYRG